MNLLYWLIFALPLWQFNADQIEIRSHVDNETEILNVPVKIVAFENKICFIGQITECYYIVEKHKNEYVLANVSIVRVLENRIIYNDEHEVAIFYKEKRFEN